LRAPKDILILRSPDSKTRGSRDVLEAAGYQVKSAETCWSRPSLVVIEAETVHAAREIADTQLEDLRSGNVPLLMLAQDLAERANSVNVLPSNPDTRTLLQRVRQLTRTEERGSYEFPENAQPEATVTAIGRVVEMNETTLLLESSVKLTAEEFVSIKGPGVRLLGVDSTLFRRTKRFSRLTQGRHFMSECSVYYSEPGVLMRIRKWMRGLFE
jgi:hypothetical protein